MSLLLVCHDSYAVTCMHRVGTHAIASLYHTFRLDSPNKREYIIVNVVTSVYDDLTVTLYVTSYAVLSSR